MNYVVPSPGISLALSLVVSFCYCHCRQTIASTAVSQRMYDFNSSTLFPADFFQQAEFLYELQSLEQLQSEGLPLHHTADVGQSEGAMSDSTPTSSDTSSDSIIEVVQRPQARKRQLQTSERCDSDALIRMRKTRKLRDRQGTAKVRAKGACYECQLKKKGVSTFQQNSLP